MPQNVHTLPSRDEASLEATRLFKLALIGGFCALTAVTACVAFAFHALPLSFAIQAALTFWGPYALATPAVIFVARRLPQSGLRWPRYLLVHIAAMILFVVFCEGIFTGLVRLSQPQMATLVAERAKRDQPAPPGFDPLRNLNATFNDPNFDFTKVAFRVMLFKAQVSVPLYWVLVGAAHAFGAMAKLREREKQAAQLTAHLVQAQLTGLRAQLQPHFLFNTLNSIAALIPQDPKLAAEMVLNLSDLLRMTLREPQRSEIRLREELALLENYVAIQKLRFRERLAYRVEANDEAGACYVPPLLLQPLVENAIRHGVEASDSAEQVIVACKVVGAHLLLKVTNTGSSPPGEERIITSSTGVGLANTQARLKFQYGEEHYFSAGALDGGGFEVTIRIPAGAERLPPRVGAS